MASAVIYNILDTRDYNKIDNKINNLSNTVNSKEHILQNNINDLFSKHDALKAYAENNKVLIDGLTEDKISHDEIANDIDGSYADKEEARNVPLSAAFGGVLVNRAAEAVSLNDEEYTRATNAERVLGERLNAVERDINTFLNNADFTEAAKDTLKEIQDYINTDVADAAQMALSIKTNSDAIGAEVNRATDAESNLDTKKINYDDIIDSLNSTEAKKPLSANQGNELRLQINNHNNLVHTQLNTRIGDIETNVTNLQNSKINTASIVNNLTDGGIAVPLSAEQGKVLNEKISTTINNHNNDVHTPLNTRIDGIDTRINGVDDVVATKVPKSDIVNNLTTDDATKVLSAKQGVVLKGLYDNIPAWSLSPTKPTYTYTEVGADADGAATNAVNNHNTNTSAHSNIINPINEEITKLKNGKANASDIPEIVDNINTDDSAKVLSAKQGKALYDLIQNLIERVEVLEGNSVTTE